jgi:hypothetical protein
MLNTIQIGKAMKYARKCDYCQYGMNEGFVCNDGYFCSESCRDTSRDLRGYNEFSDEVVDIPSLDDVVVFDNGGESYDRYTVFIPSGAVYGMSEGADGFNMYIGDEGEVDKGSHLGVELDAVPDSIKYAVMGRIMDDSFDDDSEYWTMWDESHFNQVFYYSVEFDHGGKNRQITFEISEGETDCWVTATDTDGTKFDMHYCEESNSVNVYEVIMDTMGLEIYFEEINNEE